MVVAEGIEQAAQREPLIRMRCPYGQGCLFAELVAAETVETWLPGSPSIGRPMLTAGAPAAVER